MSTRSIAALPAVALAALAASACSRGGEGPIDVGVVDARTLLEVALDARSTLAAPHFRVQLRADLAEALARTGSTTRARVELRGALDEARALTDPGDRDRALGRVARVQLALGDKAEAQAVVAQIRSLEDRGALEADLVDTLPAALALTPVSERERALARLARAWARAGELDRAGAAAGRIEDGSLRGPVMGALCAAMLRAGRTVDAKRMIGTLDGLARSEAEAAQALEAARKGDQRSAHKWAEGIESEPVRARTWAQLATLSPGGSPERRRRSAEALTTALDVRSPDLRTAAVEAVVRVWADAGDALTADTVMGTALAAPVRSEPGRNALDAAGARRVRVVVATAYAAERDTVSAARVAAAIDDPVLSADAWAAIARASVRAGLPEAALAAASRIVPDELRLPVIADIAVAPGPPPTSGLRAALTTALTRTP